MHSFDIKACAQSHLRDGYNYGVLTVERLYTAKSAGVLLLNLESGPRRVRWSVCLDGGVNASRMRLQVLL